MLDIAWQSLRNRWSTALLAVLAIAISVALILTVDQVRRDARTAFVQTVSGTDLVIGARSGAVQLLLYSVFRMGNATNNMSWESATEIAERQEVAWTIPLSLGDSYRGYRVLGTNQGYFTHYRFGRDRQLSLNEGVVFDDVFDAVLGSEVARALDHEIGDEIIIAHGTGSVGLTTHDNQPFSVAGILAPTGTPVDRTVHVSLEGIEAVHVDWRNGMQVRGEGTPADVVREMDLEPSEITAMMVGLKSRGTVFRVQRAINEYRAEPLLAILPGVALQQLWDLVGVAEKALLAVSAVVVFAGLINLISVLLSSLAERRREMAILRSAGASPGTVFRLLCLESSLLAIAGIVAGFLLHQIVVRIVSALLSARFGLDLPSRLPGVPELLLCLAILAGAIIAGAIPAWRAYRQSLADGMAQRT
jgi:putative ABC transport system permease protein